MFIKIINKNSEKMNDINDNSIDLVVTSPPYWNVKDYGHKDQTGFNQDYSEYIASMNKVWSECYRSLKGNSRLCINIGDTYTRTKTYGRYKVISIRTDIINHCLEIGFDYLGAIIWQKVSNCKTSGGASVMGSFPYPKNGIVSLDYEYILLFKKLGKPEKVSKEIKDKSKMTTEQWRRYFAGHWNFNGTRQTDHIAMFPIKLPERLIRMFSFVEGVVLDPFVGSGTTCLAAKENGRDSIGYEINPDYLTVIKKKVGFYNKGLFNKCNYQIM